MRGGEGKLGRGSGEEMDLVGGFGCGVEIAVGVEVVCWFGGFTDEMRLEWALCMRV